MCIFPGCHTSGDAVLDSGGYPQAGETRDRPGLRLAGLRHHGKVAEVRRGRQDVHQAGRGGGRQKGKDRTTHW